MSGPEFSSGSYSLLSQGSKIKPPLRSPLRAPTGGFIAGCSKGRRRGCPEFSSGSISRDARIAKYPALVVLPFSAHGSRRFTLAPEVSSGRHSLRAGCYWGMVAGYCCCAVPV